MVSEKGEKFVIENMNFLHQKVGNFSSEKNAREERTHSRTVVLLETCKTVFFGVLFGCRPRPVPSRRGLTGQIPGTRMYRNQSYFFIFSHHFKSHSCFLFEKKLFIHRFSKIKTQKVKNHHNCQSWFSLYEDYFLYE